MHIGIITIRNKMIIPILSIKLQKKIQIDATLYVLSGVLYFYSALLSR